MRAGDRLGNISFTPVAGQTVSFLHQDATGTAFTKSDTLPILLDPYNRRYLITDANNELYTVEGALLKLNETELTGVFETYGIRDIPDGNLLLCFPIRRSSTGMIREPVPALPGNLHRYPEATGHLLGKHRYVRFLYSRD